MIDLVVQTIFGQTADDTASAVARLPWTEAARYSCVPCRLRWPVQ